MHAFKTQQMQVLQDEAEHLVRRVVIHTHLALGWHPFCLILLLLLYCHADTIIHF